MPTVDADHREKQGHDIQQGDYPSCWTGSELPQSTPTQETDHHVTVQGAKTRTIYLYAGQVKMDINPPIIQKKKKKQFERRLLNIIHRILRWRMMSCFSTLLLHRRPFKGWTDTGWNESKHCTDRPPAVSQTPLVKSACLSQHLSLNIMFTGLAGPSKVVLWYYNSVYEWLSLSSSFGLIFFFFFLGAWIQRLWCLTCWQFMLLLISFYA